VQDLASQTPMTERTLFRIYSMTRAITSVAVMMLYEEHRFALDDPVSKYIPEFANVKVALPDGSTRAPTRAITVADLMLHTSGLSPRTAEIYRREKVRAREYTMNQFIANLVRVPLMEDPGTRFRYSEGTSVLGRLVEIWSGQPFETFLDERIFRPLRMTDTRFWADTPEQRARLATVYSPAPGGGLTPIELETIPFTQRPMLIEGAVGLLSSVPDYVRFSQMLLNNGELEGVKLLREETVEMMTRNGLSEAVQQTRGGTMGWGLGNVNVLLSSSGSDAASVGEYGWDGTAGTIFWVDPVKKTVIVLMTQNSPADPDRLRSRFKEIVQQALQQ
jgi:CubicO group peptidase (beta-lactamase class C family)